MVGSQRAEKEGRTIGTQFGRRDLILGDAMRRARLLCLIGSLSALALAVPAMISLADPAVKGPEPQDVTADLC